VSEALLEESEESFVADAEGEGDADGEAALLDEESSPPVKMPVMASPMSLSTLSLLLDGEGVAVEAPSDVDVDLLAVAEGVGVGSALSSEPESGEEVLPVSDDFDADGLGSSVDLSVDLSVGVPLLVEADGDGVAEALALASSPVTAATQSLYSSAVRLLEEEWSSAFARVGVSPMPIRTAVGIAARAIALPAGMWNLVNSGFLGAAWRGPVLTRDSSTSVPWVTLSAGTVPPVRPVGRARS